MAEPDDIAIAFGADDDGRGARAAPRERGCLTIAFAAAGRGVGASRRRPTTRSCARSWSRRSTTCCGSSCTCSSSTAACSRAAAEPVHDAGASSFLYPFLAEARARPRRACSRTCARSVLMKAAEVGALRAQTLAEGRDALRAAAAALRARSTRRALLALGNGGSATDAMDVVADFRARRAAGRRAARSTSPRTRRSSPRSPTTSASRRSSRAR